jgi:hypothetical protein
MALRAVFMAFTIAACSSAVKGAGPAANAGEASVIARAVAIKDVFLMLVSLL